MTGTPLCCSNVDTVPLSERVEPQSMVDHSCGFRVGVQYALLLQASVRSLGPVGILFHDAVGTTVSVALSGLFDVLTWFPASFPPLCCNVHHSGFFVSTFCSKGHQAILRYTAMQQQNCMLLLVYLPHGYCRQ